MANRAAILRQQNTSLSVSRRGKHFIEFDLGNGVKRFVSTIEPLHYGDGTQEIETQWAPTTGTWQLQMLSGDAYEARARSTFNAGDLLEYRHRASGEWTIFDPQSINWINQDNSRQQIAIKQAVAAQVVDDRLTFPAGYGPGRHFEYQVHPERLRKIIKIDAASNLPAATVSGTVWLETEFTIKHGAGVNFYLDGVLWPKANNVRIRTGNRIEIRDGGGNVLFYLDPPSAWDSAGNTVGGQYEVRRSGGATSLFITVRIPKAWVDSAVFPIFLDPTYSSQPDATAGIDTWLIENTPDVNNGTSTTLSNRLGGGTQRFSLLRFDVSSISGATVNSATLSVYNDDTATATRSNNPHSILAANSGWTELGATWNYAVASTTRWAGDTGANGGSDAGCSVSGTDFNATGHGLLTYTANNPSGTESTSVLVASQIQDWVDGNNYGLICIPTQSNIFAWRSSDHATAGTRPKLVIDYTAGGPAVSGTATVTGNGALTSTGAKGALAAATVTGNGTLAATGQKAAQGTATVTGNGTLAASGQKHAAGAVTISGNGVLLVTGQKGAASAVVISGNGQITASGQASRVGIASLSGNGQLSASGQTDRAGQAVISGGGTLNATGNAATAGSGTATLSGGGSLTVTGQSDRASVVAITGNGDPTAIGQKHASGTASITGGGTLSATGTSAETRFGTASISGGGSLSALGIKHAISVAGITGDGSLITTGTSDRSGGALISGGGTLTEDHLTARFGVALVSGGGSLTAVSVAVGVNPTIVSPTRAVMVNGRTRLTTSTGRTKAEVS